LIKRLDLFKNGKFFDCFEVALRWPVECSLFRMGMVGIPCLLSQGNQCRTGERQRDDHEGDQHRITIGKEETPLFLIGAEFSVNGNRRQGPRKTATGLAWRTGEGIADRT